LILLAAFWAGWLALERRHQWLAGLAFGPLALKPQFGIPLAVVVLACGEWRLLAGAASSVLAQAAAVWLLLGPTAFTTFAGSIPTTMAYADLLEAKPFMSHSLRALTRLTPNWIGLPLWGILAVIVLWYTVRVWKSQAPVRVKLGTVVLASVLVNPSPDHLRPHRARAPASVVRRLHAGACQTRTGRTVLDDLYWLFALTFAPTAAVIGLQASVIVMLGLLVLVSRAVHDESTIVSPVDIAAPAPARA
jgi:hypothetical protein